MSEESQHEFDARRRTEVVADIHREIGRRVAEGNRDATAQVLGDAAEVIGTAHAEIERCHDRLVIGPQGDDRIDELESAADHLRARLADVESSASVEDEPEDPVPGPLERLIGLVEGLRREFGRDDPMWAPADTITGLVDQLEEEMAQGGLVVRPATGSRP